jgi:DNA polymerase/3'-5' exonuclease PolX
VKDVSQVEGLEGIGGKIADKVGQILETGSTNKLRELERDPKVCTTVCPQLFALN